MTAQILISDLTSLIQESKRKNADIKHAAEISLQEIKNIQVTSEKQVAADLARRPQFVNPFLLACTSRNAKCAAIGMSCLQRMAASQALAKSKVKDVLEAMTECTSLGLDIQLKMLQTLPSLLQNYADQVNGAPLFTTFQICSTLQASKTPSVSSTSAATLQQLVTSLYEKLAAEDERALEIPTVTEVSIDDVQIPVRTVAFDAFRVLHDLCLLLEGSKPRYIRFSPTPQPVLLELVESVFTGHSAMVNTHPEQAHLVRSILIPNLITTFSEGNDFAIIVRVTRLLYLIVKHHVDLFPEQTEAILQWLNHCLDPDASALWKRILCMEVFREIYTDYQLVLRIHARFNGKDGTKSIVPDCLASFVRLAAEKPALIGLGQQSSIPIGHYFQRDTGSESGESLTASSGAAGVPTSAVPGLSIQFSSVRTPCIEQLDKVEPPNVPETYIYSLVLGSLNNLAESLAKFLLPVTVSDKPRRRKTLEGDQAETESVEESRPERRSLQRKLPINPLDLEDHKLFCDIQTAANLLDMTWPAVLATCSTFFNSALDADNYRALVRSFQKFTQVAGLLHMTVPRDAFMTTLGKSAMPPNILTATISSAGSQPPQTPSFLSNAKGLLNVENIVNQASSFLPDRRRPSIDSGDPTLNVRNLLCLRALLNLAIALGPTLDSSWTIILETLLQADKVLAGSSAKAVRDRVVSGGAQSTSNGGTPQQQMAVEVAAVQAAASRLFESTAEFPNEAFLFVLKGLCGLVETRNQPPPQGVSSSPGHKRRIASFSGLSIKTGIQEHDFMFAISKMKDIALINLERFIHTIDERESGWTIILDQLTSFATSRDVPPKARLLSVGIVRQLVLDSVAYPSEDDEDLERKIQNRALAPLNAISAIFKRESAGISNADLDDTTVEEHGIILDTLRGLLEHVGESLINGWPAVFTIILSSFRPEMHGQPSLISVNLGRSAFSSLQLICSDFLSSKLDQSLLSLIDLLYSFASQEQDLNISLTVCALQSEARLIGLDYDFLLERVGLPLRTDVPHGAAAACC